MKYVVKPGDTLSKIAKDAYGDANRWREIFEANKDKIQNPNQIRSGWELVIPGLEAEQGAQTEAEKVAKLGLSADEGDQAAAAKKAQLGRKGPQGEELT
jgi:hypothetical protein